MTNFMWLLMQVDFDVQQPIAVSHNPDLLKAKATEMNDGKPMKWLEDDAEGFTTDIPDWDSLQFDIEKVTVIK